MMMRSFLTVTLALGVGLIAVDASAFGTRTIKKCQTISKSGSYIVVRNLTASGDCLVVAADFVTIDLRGYTLTGDETGNGITDDDTPREGIALRNGVVTGFDHGIRLGATSSVIVEGIRALRNAGAGIIVGDGAIVRGNVANFNGADGIAAGEDSVVEGNAANNNEFIGISTGISTVIGNTANENQHGFFAGPGVVTDNTAYLNNEEGFFIRNGTTLAGNNARNNGGDGFRIFCPSNVRGNTAILNGLSNMQVEDATCNLDNNVAP